MKKIDVHMHLIKNICGIGAKGELSPIGDGKAIYATGDIVTLIPSFLGEYDCNPEKVLKLMDANHIEKAVLLQGNYLGFQNLYTIDAANKYPDRFIAAATLDPFFREKEKIYKHLFDDLGTKVIKMEVSNTSGLMANHPTIDLNGVEMNYLYAESAKRNLIFVIDIGRYGNDCYQIDAMRDVFLKYKEMKFVVCHLTGVKLNQMTILEENLYKFKLSNVYFDLASLPNQTKEDGYPFKTARSYIKKAIEIVGSDRLMWGSDCPQACCHVNYEEMISYIENFDEITELDKENIFYNTANSVFFNNK